MADAIPTATGAAPASARSTVIAQQTMTPWQALKEAGWWTPYDWVMVGILLGLWIVTGFWFLFSTPSPESMPRVTCLLVVLCASICLKLVWLISLIFRCSWFVLRLNADIAMLPSASARIAVAYLSGQK